MRIQEFSPSIFLLLHWALCATEWSSKGSGFPTLSLQFQRTWMDGANIRGIQHIIILQMNISGVAQVTEHASFPQTQTTSIALGSWSCDLQTQTTSRPQGAGHVTFRHRQPVASGSWSCDLQTQTTSSLRELVM